MRDSGDKAALAGLWGGAIPAAVSIVLPKGEKVQFTVVDASIGPDWSEAGIVKDAGDDPDVTHGVTVKVRVEASAGGVVFRAGEGVGTVTRPGLPVEVGAPAINPVPRLMIDQEVAEASVLYGKTPDVLVTVSIPGGKEIAQKTWNPRLGIQGGLSVLGTTGIVRPFSCAAWIASIHRGIDVARAAGARQVAGCTGNTSERVVQAMHGLPDHAMIDMGDFVGGMIKYLRRNPVEEVVIGGGIGKLTKLAQGAIDLHSGRSQVDFDQLAGWMEDPRLRTANTALEAYKISGAPLADLVAKRAARSAWALFGDQPPERLSIIVIDRGGAVIGKADFTDNSRVPQRGLS